MMNLYKITRNKHSWDEYDSFVIRAATEQEAREIARQAHDYANYADEWLDPAQSTIEVLNVNGDPGVVLGSFNAG